MPPLGTEVPMQVLRINSHDMRPSGEAQRLSLPMVETAGQDSRGAGFSRRSSWSRCLLLYGGWGRGSCSVGPHSMRRCRRAHRPSG